MKKLKFNLIKEEAMKILTVGAGFSGCSLARLMTERDHDVSIIEKSKHIGGLCYSKKIKSGLYYEPYGAHTFHTNNSQVKDFVQRFSKFNSYIHKKGIIINGDLMQYPLSLDSIKEMPNNEKILKEIEERPYKPNLKNFETYLISLVGITLYNLYIYNYTKKMWDIEPRELNVDWVINRVELRESNSELFKGQWQGLPIKGYTSFFEKMVADIPIEYRRTKFKKSNFDIVLYSGKIDELFHNKYGILPHRSLKFDYKFNDSWENENFGTINLPQHPKYIRKTNFNVLYKKYTSYPCIQYQESIPSNYNNLPMYPIATNENILLFKKYLKEICKSEKIIPFGRLGLYKYLDMDKAVSLSMAMISLIENWTSFSSEKRYKEINIILDKF